jgi:NAD(P)-dependent dehydrogenase (short-subunit alcohol dehydrogenase family)
MQNINFANKIAVVTGGASGVGKATALAFARFGANVCIIDTDAERCALLSKEHQSLSFYEVDVADAAKLAELAQRMRGSPHGVIDIFVSNAGIEDTSSGNLVTMPEQVLRRIIEVNLYGAINCVRTFIPMMRDGGKIVLVSSLQAFMACAPGTSYQASKAGLIGVAKALTIELASRNINVNVVCPAGIATEGMGARSVDREGLEDYRRNNPLGRRARPDEIAYPILFLCSDWASYMTGQVVHIDGGMSSMGMPWRGPIAVFGDDPDKLKFPYRDSEGSI